MRLDAYLAEYYPEQSRSVWQKYILDGRVRVNGSVEKSVKRLLGEDDEVAFTLPEKPDFSRLTLPVIFEDENVAVLDKPAGILTHSKGAINDEFTIAEFVRPRTSFGTDTNRPGIVHRLDRDTSGVIITAKNPETAAYLQKQFSQRTVKKTYAAITAGVPKNPTARIDAPIARHPKVPSTFRVDPKGKSASTTYETTGQKPTFARLALMPSTGRTHQLRVHLAYIGASILGDRVYGTPDDRLFLHAHTLELTLPGGDRQVFTSAIPFEFDEKWKSLPE